MSAHTPGPWQFVQEGGDWFIKGANGFSFQSSTKYYPWNSQNIADWRLIAAAPDLLAALETMVKRIEHYSAHPDDRPNIEQWEYTEGSTDMANARAAIAKATGEPA